MEQFYVNEQRTSLEFGDKDTQASQDYLVDFASMLGEGVALSSVAVTVDEAGLAESPLMLEVADSQIAAGIVPIGSPAPNTSAYFWLTGGTSGTRYLGKVVATVIASGSPLPPNRVIVKRFLIVIQGYEHYGSPDDDNGSPNVGQSPAHYHNHRWGEPRW